MTYIGLKCYKAPYTLASKHTRAHIPHLPSCLWPNLSDLSHPRAFSSVCPSWTLVHLTAPQGAFLIAQPDFRRSSWGWHPPGDEVEGGGRKGMEVWPLYSQTTTESEKLQTPDKRTWEPGVICAHMSQTPPLIYAHKHACIHLCKSECANTQRALKLIHLFCIKIKVMQAQLNASLFIKSISGN